MKWTTTITRELIAAVEERPALWDSSLDDYSRKNSTATKWDEVGGLLNCKGVVAKEKWRKMRMYFKSLRRKMLQSKSGQGADESYMPPSEFYKDMSFLIPSMKPKKSQCNLLSTEELETSPQSQCDQNEMDTDVFTENEVVDAMTTEDILQDDSSQNDSSTQISSGDSQNKQPQPPPLRNRLPLVQRLKHRKESEESAVMLDLMGNVSNALKQHKPKDTADDHFAAHISCQLRNIAESEEKDRAKIRIIQVISDLKYGPY